MFVYLELGGPLMWLILVCSVIFTAFFFERLLYYHRVTIRVGEFLRGLANLLERRNFAEALHECKATPGPVARVIHAAVLRHDSPRSELREIVQEAGQLEVPRLERNLPVIATIAFVAPLLGLLGTVLGLLETFMAISAQSGVVSSTDFSRGIYRSLLTTAGGLAVAIPCSLAYSYFSARVNSLLHDMERGGIEIVNLIAEKQGGAQIIDFGPAHRTKAAE